MSKLLRLNRLTIISGCTDNDAILGIQGNESGDAYLGISRNSNKMLHPSGVTAINLLVLGLSLNQPNFTGIVESKL